MSTPLIEYLHAVYPELEVDISEIKGYSVEEIQKIERLYDIMVTDQFREFLSCMGRCSGVFLVMTFLCFIGKSKMSVHMYFLN